MTRINVVDPSELADPHLLAECRELPRVFGLALAAIERAINDVARANPDMHPDRVRALGQNEGCRMAMPGNFMQQTQ